MIRLTSKVALAVTAALVIAGAANAQQQAPTAAPPPPPLIDWDKIEIKTIDLGNKPTC
jgi:hypothetical protein